MHRMYIVHDAKRMMTDTEGRQWLAYCCDPIKDEIGRPDGVHKNGVGDDWQ